MSTISCIFAVPSLYQLAIHSVASYMQSAAGEDSRITQSNIQELPLPKLIKRHLSKHAHTVATHDGLDDYNSESDSDFDVDEDCDSDSDSDPDPPSLSDTDSDLDSDSS